MFELIDIYHIVSAAYHELEWQDQSNLEEAVEVYSTLTSKKQSQFNKLIITAKSQCSSDFSSLPDSYETELDMELKEQIIADIMNQLQPIFKKYLQ